MKDTRLLMGMPITVEVVDTNVKQKDIDAVFKYFKEVDERFSTYKNTSEITMINNGKLSKKNYSPQMKNVLKLCEITKKETLGYFDISNNGRIDPSGLVKGWSIWNASKILKKKGYKNYYVNAGGDIQMEGLNNENKMWQIGIRNPFERSEIVKVIGTTGHGVATSGSYIRGQHIYNPFTPSRNIVEVVSLTVIGPNIYDADRFATAAFAMGKKGIEFIHSLKNFEAYMIDQNGQAIYTKGFSQYVV